MHVSAKDFATSEEFVIDVVATRRNILNVSLKIAPIQSQVKVSADNGVSVEPAANADQTSIAGRDLEVLPEDPDDLAAALQALAGPSLGPDDGQILIDGFSNGHVPARDSIREIRINQNPFAAESDIAGGRIEIQTKAGSDKLRGTLSWNFTYESLNSRNPLQTASPKRAPFQVRRLGGSISGPLKKKKASFYLDFSRNEIDDDELIRATVLDSSLHPVSLSQLAFTPRRYTSFGQRVDYAISPINNLTARYSYNRTFSPTADVGGFSLPERSLRQTSIANVFQFTDTAVLKTNVVNETRLQYSRSRVEAVAASSNPTLNVDGSFLGGGASGGNNITDRWELQNITQIQKGTHMIKFGGRFRSVSVTDVNAGNFNGQWTFAGGSSGLTSLERYRRTLQLQLLGLTAEQIRAAGGGAAQFSIAIGNPSSSVSQFDFEPFAQDDWRVWPNLTLSYGLRYEIQNNAGSRMGFAPRLSIAWSPRVVNPGQSPKTVIRAGAGIFYRRFGETSTLTANHLNGVNVQQFSFSESTNPSVPTDPFTLSILNSFRCVDGSATPDCITSLPSLAGAQPVTQTIFRVAPGLRVPAIYLFAAQIERQLPKNFSLVVGTNVRHIVHAIRIRDVNAPTPTGARPNPALGEINQFEGAGRFLIEQLSVSFNSRLNPHFSVNGNYSLNKAMSDTEGQSGGDIPGVPPFPSDSYDISRDWSPAYFDVRHYFSLFGTYSNPKLWKLTFAPFILARSAYPFNITTGIDSNLDRQFMDRPSFAGPNADCAAPSIRCTRYGNFNLIPNAGETIIPRNFGRGTAVLSVNLRVSRSFGFGTNPDKKYNLTLSVAVQNLLNAVNPAVPIGNLSSPLFGVAQGLTGFGGVGGGGSADAANRRVYINAQFSF